MCNLSEIELIDVLKKINIKTKAPDIFINEPFLLSLEELIVKKELELSEASDNFKNAISLEITSLKNDLVNCQLLYKYTLEVVPISHIEQSIPKFSPITTGSVLDETQLKDAKSALDIIKAIDVATPIAAMDKATVTLTKATAECTKSTTALIVQADLTKKLIAENCAANIVLFEEAKLALEKSKRHIYNSKTSLEVFTDFFKDNVFKQEVIVPTVISTAFGGVVLLAAGVPAGLVCGGYLLFKPLLAPILLPKISSLFNNPIVQMPSVPTSSPNSPDISGNSPRNYSSPNISSNATYRK